MKYRPESDYLTEEDLFTDEELSEFKRSSSELLSKDSKDYDISEYPDLWGLWGNSKQN